MKALVQSAIDDAIAAVATLKENVDFIERAADLISSCFKKGGKLLCAGNGGSLCDAAHMAEEFTGYFRKKRPALPAIVLGEPGHMSCVSNDEGFDAVFSRSIEALGRKEDLFVGLSTSGNSANLVRAFAAAKERGLATIALLGRGGGALRGVADLELIIDGFETSDRIQEVHMAAIHMIIELVEEILFYTPIQEGEKILQEITSAVVR